MFSDWDHRDDSLVDEVLDQLWDLTHSGITVEEAKCILRGAHSPDDLEYLAQNILKSARAKDFDIARSKEKMIRSKYNTDEFSNYYSPFGSPNDMDEYEKEIELKRLHKLYRIKHPFDADPWNSKRISPPPQRTDVIDMNIPPSLQQHLQQQLLRIVVNNNSRSVVRELWTAMLKTSFPNLVDITSLFDEIVTSLPNFISVTPEEFKLTASGKAMAEKITMDNIGETLFVAHDTIENDEVRAAIISTHKCFGHHQSSHPSCIVCPIQGTCQRKFFVDILPRATDLQKKDDSLANLSAVLVNLRQRPRPSQFTATEDKVCSACQQSIAKGSRYELVGQPSKLYHEACSPKK